MIDIGWFSLVQDQTDDWFSHLWGCVWQWSHLDFTLPGCLVFRNAGWVVQAYRPIAATNMALQVSFPIRVCGDTDLTCDFQAFLLKWFEVSQKLHCVLLFSFCFNEQHGPRRVLFPPGPTQVILCVRFLRMAHFRGRAYHFEDLICISGIMWGSEESVCPLFKIFQFCNWNSFWNQPLPLIQTPN